MTPMITTKFRDLHFRYCQCYLNVEYYSSVIKENSGNQKVLIKTVQKLLQKPIVNCYPPSDSDRMRADEFATFFATNIDLLVKKMSLIDSVDSVTDEVLIMSLTLKFSTFTEMKMDEIGKLATKLFSKSCVLDP